MQDTSPKTREYWMLKLKRIRENREHFKEQLARITGVELDRETDPLYEMQVISFIVEFQQWINRTYGH